MFNPKIALFLCTLGFGGFIVNGATTVELASFFSIIAGSVYLMKNKRLLIANNFHI